MNQKYDLSDKLLDKKDKKSKDAKKDQAKHKEDDLDKQEADLEAYLSTQESDLVPNFASDAN